MDILILNNLKPIYANWMLAKRKSPGYKMNLTDGYLEPGQFDHNN